MSATISYVTGLDIIYDKVIMLFFLLDEESAQVQHTDSVS